MDEAAEQIYRRRIRDLEAALVYSAFAQHGTPLNMLPPGIRLIDDSLVEVMINGSWVKARSPADASDVG